MNPQSIQLDAISAGMQVRAGLDDTTVADYAEAMREGAKFPPVEVYSDGSEFILADGFHRLAAARQCGLQNILAEVHQGTSEDALRHALGANAAHGLRRSNADKRRCVTLALQRWPKLSNRAIADICAVGAPLVGHVRLVLNCNNITVEDDEPSRVGRDGKERKMPTKKRREMIDIQAAPSPEQKTPPPEPEPARIQTAEQEINDDPSPAYSRIMQRMVEDQSDFELLKNEDEKMQVKQSMRELAERLK